MPDLRTRLGRVGAWLNLPGSAPIDEVRATVREIEQLGYGAVWYAETPVTRDALVQAALLLEATEAIQVATGIASVYSRDAIAMRAGASALEEAFPGRFVLGMGVSHAPAVESRGHDYGKPVKTMRTYLDALEDPGAPVVLAALRPRMLGLARDRASGAHPYFVPVEHTRRAREALGDGPVLAPEVTVLLETDADRARERARRFMHRYLSLPNYRNNLLELGYSEADTDPERPSDALADAVVGWGDANAIAARVAEHHEAGADHVCIQPLAADLGGALGQLRELAPVLL